VRLRRADKSIAQAKRTHPANDGELSPTRFLTEFGVSARSVLAYLMAVLLYMYACAPVVRFTRLPSNFTVALQRGQALPVSGMSSVFLHVVS
jgi:hypothetical protein